MTFSEKCLRAPGVLETAGRRVKRYHISAIGEQVAEGIQATVRTVNVPEPATFGAALLEARSNALEAAGQAADVAVAGVTAGRPSK
jgi:hypothetical protein